jgi:hypothetical protein
MLVEFWKHCFITDVIDMGKKFIVGVIDTGKQFFVGVSLNQ